MEIEFPPYTFRWKESDGQRLIYDVIRRRYVRITPEEWVRQHLIHFMMDQCKYPKSRISVEKKVVLQGMTRRTDAIVYDQAVQPWLILECKAPEVALRQHALDQIAAYHAVLRAPYLAICNGKELWIARVHVETGRWEALSEWPIWTEIPST